MRLGQEAKDLVTGFAGVITGRVEYLTGCAQVLLQPRVKEGGDFLEARWFDETRVVVDPDGAVVTIPNAEAYPGSCDAAPVK